jgi:hypothetical protein
MTEGQREALILMIDQMRGLLKSDALLGRASIARLKRDMDECVETLRAKEEEEDDDQIGFWFAKRFFNTQ